MKTRRVLPIALVALVLAWPGIVAEEQGTSPTATPSPTVPLVIPPEASATPNPLQATEQNVADGMELFASQCAMCHGTAGAGDGKLAARLAIRMPDFTNKAAEARRTDGDLFYILSHGHGRMPAETRLDEPSRWKMVLAVRAMAR